MTQQGGNTTLDCLLVFACIKSSLSPFIFTNTDPTTPPQHHIPSFRDNNNNNI